MSGLFGDAHRPPCQAAAARIPDAVVAHHTVSAGEAGLTHERLEPVGEDAGVDEHDRLPAAPRLVLELEAVDVRRSEEHTSELQSQSNLVCRLLLEKKKN